MEAGKGRRRSLIHGYGAARRASWLELFFDLVFVVAVFRLGQRLVNDPSARGVLVFAGLIGAVWWLWFSFSYFADLFDDDRPPSRLMQMTAMLGVLALSASLPGASAADANRFAVTYGLLLVLLAASYGLVGWIDVEARDFCAWNAAGFLIAAARQRRDVRTPRVRPGKLGAYPDVAHAGALRAVHHRRARGGGSGGGERHRRRRLATGVGGDRGGRVRHRLRSVVGVLPRHVRQ
ncbi:hypothetical protein GCM10027452_35840 [Micromonospora halotolerans]